MYSTMVSSIISPIQDSQKKRSLAVMKSLNPWDGGYQPFIHRCNGETVFVSFTASGIASHRDSL